MPGNFIIDVEVEAFNEIQEAIDYYNQMQSGLGKRFYKTIDQCFSFLKKNYLLFAIVYDDVRCMPVKKFPYMIHYRVLTSQKTISIKAVFCTHKDPSALKKRTD